MPRWLEKSSDPKEGGNKIDLAFGKVWIPQRDAWLSTVPHTLPTYFFSEQSHLATRDVDCFKKRRAQSTF
jgi:hypothetical protein